MHQTNQLLHVAGFLFSRKHSKNRTSSITGITSYRTPNLNFSIHKIGIKMPTPRLVYLPSPSNNNVSEERISADRDRSTECFPEVCKSNVKPFPTWSTDAPEQLKLEKEPKNASQSSDGPGPFHVQTPNFTASNYQNPSISLLPRQRQQQQDHQGIFHFSTRRTYRHGKHGKNSVGPFTVTKNINTGTGRAFTEVEKVPQHQLIMNAEERERDCNSIDESLPQPKAMGPIADEIKTDSLSSSIPPDTVGSSPSSSIKPIHSQLESSRPPTSQCSQIMSISLRNGTNDDGCAIIPPTVHQRNRQKLRPKFIHFHLLPLQVHLQKVV